MNDSTRHSEFALTWWLVTSALILCSICYIIVRTYIDNKRAKKLNLLMPYHVVA